MTMTEVCGLDARPPVRHCRTRAVSAFTAAAVGAGTLLLGGGVATAAEVNCALAPGEPTTCTVVYAYTGDEQVFLVPAGVTELGVIAVGAAGGGSAAGGAGGGVGAVVTGTVAVAPGSTLYVEVGRQGFDAPPSFSDPAAGGFNGGGRAGDTVVYTGAGGGGASDVRTASNSGEAIESLSSRLLVAGAGGGSAHFVDGRGGDAGQAGSTRVGFGQAQPGTQTAGGSGAPAAFDTSDGESGALGVGGSGGDYTGGDGGYGAGGGGGGYYGGGGGSSFGGGAGGSSLVPDGGTLALADGRGPGSVTLNYTIGPASVSPLGGDGQSAPAGAAFGTPLQVQVLDGLGDPAAGAPVTFSVTSGAATVTPSEPVITDAAGQASVQLTAGNQPGPVTVTATTPGATSATFTATVTAPPPPPANEADLQVSIAGPASAPAGSTVTYTMTVKNAGPGNAVNVRSVLSAAGVATSATNPAAQTGTVKIGSTTLTGARWTLAALPAADGQHTVTYSLTGKVTAKRGQLLTVAGGALSSTPDPGPGANLSFKFTRVT